MKRAVVLLAMAAAGASVGDDAWQRAPVPPFLGLPPAVDAELTGFPRLLSQTAIFTDLATLQPRAGLAPYVVNQPLWSDGATKRRWMAVPTTGAPHPAKARITFAADGAWQFPRGTVFVKHFELPQDLRTPDGAARRLETRILAVRRGGDVYGVTYRWRADGTDAELLTDTARDEVATIDESGQPLTIAWQYPSPAQCITCHTKESGGVLGVNTRQCNCAGTDGNNQLVALGTHDWLDREIDAAATATLPRLTHLDAGDVTLPDRIRSYLDANCSHCHQPASRVGGAAFGLDLRLATPLERQGLLDGVAHNALGITDGRILAARSAERSVLLDRVSRRGDAFAMPPLGSARPDPRFLAALRQWIAELPER